MWQRIQTVYLLLAAICGALCLGMPIAEIIPQELATNESVYSYSYFLGNGEESGNDVSLSVICLFAMIICCVDTITTIFMYKDLKRQKTFCMASALGFCLWYVCYAIMFFCSTIEGEMVPTFAACLPFVSIVFVYLALKGIKHDWNLLRSADRIR